MYSRCDLSTRIFIRIYGYGYGSTAFTERLLILCQFLIFALLDTHTDWFVLRRCWITKVNMRRVTYESHVTDRMCCEWLAGSMLHRLFLLVMLMTSHHVTYPLTTSSATCFNNTQSDHYLEHTTMSVCVWSVLVGQSANTSLPSVILPHTGSNCYVPEMELDRAYAEEVRQHYHQAVFEVDFSGSLRYMTEMCSGTWTWMNEWNCDDIEWVRKTDWEPA